MSRDLKKERPQNHRKQKKKLASGIALNKKLLHVKDNVNQSGVGGNICKLYI